MLQLDLRVIDHFDMFSCHPKKQNHSGSCSQTIGGWGKPWEIRIKPCKRFDTNHQTVGSLRHVSARDKQLSSVNKIIQVHRVESCKIKPVFTLPEIFFPFFISNWLTLWAWWLGNIYDGPSGPVPLSVCLMSIKSFTLGSALVQTRSH